MPQKIGKWLSSPANQLFCWSSLNNLVRSPAIILPTLTTLLAVYFARPFGFEFTTEISVFAYILFLSTLVAIGAKIIFIACPPEVKSVSRHGRFKQKVVEYQIGQRDIDEIYEIMGKKRVNTIKSSDDATHEYYNFQNHSLKFVRVSSGILLYLGSAGLLAIELGYMLVLMYHIICA